MTIDILVRTSVNEDGQLVVSLLSTDNKTVVMAPIVIVRAISGQLAREILDRQGYDVVKKA